MYRINLYPEHADKRRRTQGRMLRMAVLTTVIAFEAVLIVALVITGVLLHERAGALQAEITHLSTDLQSQVQPRPDLEVARELLGLRRARIDWSPKLAALSQQIEPRLTLTSITGRAPDNVHPAAFEIAGRVRDERTGVEAVSRFIAALRADRRLNADFPEIQLGNLGGGSAGKFKVSCGALGESS